MLAPIRSPRPVSYGLVSFVILLSSHCLLWANPPSGKTELSHEQSPEITIVKYRDFGAIGDGKSDDFEALAKAHDFANSNELPVRAEDGVTYYLGGANRTINIETSTDFGTAKFIIDDTSLENFRANLFSVNSTFKPLNLKTIESLKQNQPAIDVGLPASCVVTVTDSKVKRFIRRGRNQNNGSSQTDVFLVDNNGKVDPKTPIIWDFNHISKIEALPIDKEALFITGGEFTTIANASDVTDYYARGIAIRRSNVTVDGLVHLIKGEGPTGAPYRGFLDIAQCAHVVVKNTILTGHKTYRKTGNAGKEVAMGSYDINMNRALNVTLLNCHQSNDIMDSKYWGIVGSNFCKNLTFDNCSLSRFDAHQGVTNATIRNSTIGYMGVKLTGGGSFLMENTTVTSRNLIDLRSDYGSTWNGDITVRNCQFVLSGKSSGASLLAGFNDGQHDFGYPCHMPSRIFIDKLKIVDSKTSKDEKSTTIFANFNPKLTNDSYKEKYPYTLTQQAILKDVTTESGQPLRLSDNPSMFRNVQVSRR